MQHVAIDLGGRESQLCARATDGSIVKEARVATKSLPKLLEAMEPSRVILETSAEAFLIADAALAHGHEVRVVPATLVKQLGVGARGIKTDRRDAQALSEVSCRIDLPSVHIPSQLARELKSVCGSREILVKTRTMVINNVRGWARTQLVRVRTGSTLTFQDRVREYAAANQISLPEHIGRQLAVLDALKVQIKAADQQLVKLSGEHPVCRKLMTVPGVGPVTAVRFVAAIDDVTRFRNAHAVQSYLGLTPGEHSSSERKQHTGITKAGAMEVRRALIQAAWAAFRRASKEPMVGWATQIAARRGVFIAIVALARKMAGMLFAMWRDGTTYRSSKSAEEVAPA
jgi:transposase